MRAYNIMGRTNLAKNRVSAPKDSLNAGRTPSKSSSSLKTSKSPSKPSAGRKSSDRFSRPPLERMWELHHMLQANSYPNCRKVAEQLEVSAKTIQRDIEFMRDRFSLPIEYDQLKFGFFYTEPVTSFPNIEVTEGEIVSLFVAKKALVQYKGTSFEKPLRAAFQKISEGLRDTIVFGWNEIDSAFSFRGIGGSEADLELFETVSRTVLRSTEIEFVYKKLGGTGYEPRRIRPYHLACIENQWYLFGFDLARKQLRTFALPRMRKIRDTKSKFKRPADFSIGEHLSSSFGVFTGNGDYRVKVQFDAFAARLVAERQWHASQRIKTLPGGGAELTMRLGGLEEVERWILSWGSHARVLAPKELVESIRKSAEAILQATEPNA